MCEEGRIRVDDYVAMLEFVKESAAMGGRVGGDDDVDWEIFGEEGRGERFATETINNNFHPREGVGC